MLLIMSKVSMSWKHDQSQVFAEVVVLSLSEVSVQFMQITSKSPALAKLGDTDFHKSVMLAL